VSFGLNTEYDEWRLSDGSYDRFVTLIIRATGHTRKEVAAADYQIPGQDDLNILLALLPCEDGSVPLRLCARLAVRLRQLAPKVTPVDEWRACTERLATFLEGAVRDHQRVRSG
jgi:hypothetical protein